MIAQGVIVAQLGARDHYSLASMAQAHGVLTRLITDFWNPYGKGLEKLAALSGIGLAIRAAGRYSAEIPNSKVVSISSMGVRSRCLQWLNSFDPTCNDPNGWIETGRRFSLRGSTFLDVPHQAFFGYAGACLEMLVSERLNGVRSILGQTDAGGRFHMRLLRTEEDRFPEMRGGVPQPPEEHLERIEREWHEATHIIVNSAWTRQALIEERVPADKVSVVPLSFRSSARQPRPGKRTGLNVLCLGRVSLLKGFVYAREAARKLEGSGIRFTFAGVLGVPEKELCLPGNASYIGLVPRSAVAGLYETHDVFLFPTLSDGFGMTQLEALSYGLPVLATPCCGAVVEHRKSGFIIPPRDSDAICAALLDLENDHDFIRELQAGALQRSSAFEPERIWPVVKQAFFGESIIPQPAEQIPVGSPAPGAH